MPKLILIALCALSLHAKDKCEFFEYLAQESQVKLSDLHFSQIPKELKNKLYDLEQKAYFRHKNKLDICKMSVNSLSHQQAKCPLNFKDSRTFCAVKAFLKPI